MASKKVLKPKQLMINTSHSTLPTMQNVGSFKYLVQTQHAAADQDFDRNAYENEHLAFELRHDLNSVDYFGFSQRRFIGFRNRFEFEKKRLIVGNKKAYSIVGYDHRKHVYELLRQEVADKENEEIRYIDFLEDSQPQYVLILTSNKQTRKTSLQIMQVKKDQQVRDESNAVYAAIETDNHKLTNMIKENFNQGNFQMRRKKSVDNYELVPNVQKALAAQREAAAAEASKLQSVKKMAGARPDLQTIGGTRQNKSSLLHHKQCDVIMEKHQEESDSVEDINNILGGSSTQMQDQQSREMEK